jgi:indole-3-glycerol phosphate synthase
MQEIGAGALVVATESRWGGSRDDLIALERAGVQLPLVRSDFIIDQSQLYESRRAGADAVFLLPALLDDAKLASALRVAASIHLVGIVLVANLGELERALATDAPIIAITNRDLESGRIDLRATLELAPRVPTNRPVISCFGIRGAADFRSLRGKVDAVCIGSALLRAEDPAAFVAELAGP